MEDLSKPNPKYPNTASHGILNSLKIVSYIAKRSF